jgi:predicted membrane protein
MFQLENHNAKKKMPPAVPVSPVIMTGGMKEILVDFSKKQYANVELVFTLVLCLGIVFSSNIPSSIRKQLSSTVGRIALFGILFLILIYTNWVSALLFTVFIGSIISTRSTDEGMADYNVQLVDSKKRWFVEQALNENPIAIQDDKVQTSAIQDNQQTSNSKTQDTKSSNAVSKN